MKNTIIYSELLSAPKLIEHIFSNQNYFILPKFPSSFLTIARGSSDHAANFFSFLVMKYLGIPSTSLSPSTITLYHSPLKVNDIMAIFFSQSGKSPDLLCCSEYFQQNSGNTLGIINDVESPLYKKCHYKIPMGVGAELAVPATKSFLGSLAHSFRFVSSHSYVNFFSNKNPNDGISQFTKNFATCIENDYLAAVNFLELNSSHSLFVIGRGETLSLTYETALKLNEMCLEKSHGFSSAELKHGPWSVIGEHSTAIILSTSGIIHSELIQLTKTLLSRGCRILYVGASHPELSNNSHVNHFYPLYTPTHETPELEVFYIMGTIYQLLIQFSLEKKLNPDQPQFLKKITETL